MMNYLPHAGPLPNYELNASQLLHADAIEDFNVLYEFKSSAEHSPCCL